MKTYVAMQYVGDYVPGEIIRELPEESAARLLKTGAIVPAMEREAADNETPPAPEAEPEKDTEAEAAEEIATEAEAAEEIEIDALDGVVAAPKEPAKPARKTKGGKAK